MCRKFSLTNPTDSPEDVVLFRVHCFLEEIHELITAVNQRDRVGQLDAIVDLLVYTYGGAIALGFTAEQVEQAWTEVMRANMEKEVGVSKRGNKTDLIKPEGWSPPSLKAIVDG